MKLRTKEKHGPLANLTKAVVYARLDVVNSNSVVVHVRRRHSHRHDSLMTQRLNLCEIKENEVGNDQCAVKEITVSYWIANVY
jgi:hypothetical protein